MRKHLLFLLLIAVVLVSGCVSYGSQPPAAQPSANQSAAVQPPTPAPSPQPPPASAAVTIQNFAFSPSSLTVKVGTTVRWTNQDSAPHTVTFDSGTFDSGQLSNGDWFSQTFDHAGTFTYHCSNHPYMKGTIIVAQ